MTEHVKQSKTPDQRIADRLKPSNDRSSATSMVTHGTGPTRTVSSTHFCGAQQGTYSNTEGKQGGPLGNPRSGR
jgi:hypothetical protein